MQSKEKKSEAAVTRPKTNATSSTHIVTAEAVQAEEVPTIPLGSLQTINALQAEVSVHSVASTRAVSVPSPLVVQPSEYHRSFAEWLQVWWDGVRPKYLLLSFLPVLLGSVLAWTQTATAKNPFGQFHLNHFIATAVAIVLLQIGANLINDYYDYLRGVDTSNAFGPGGLIQQGLINPINVLTYGLAVLGFGLLIGVIVAVRGGPLVFLLGLIGVLCAYFYSATSRALSSLFLGEVTAFLVFGPLITLGAYLIQSAGTLQPSVFVYSLPLGLLAAAVVHVNNMRDVEGDTHAGRRTVASLLDLQLSRTLLLALLVVAYGIIVLMAIPRGAPHLLLITLWTLPLVVVVVSGALRTDSLAGLHLVMRQLIRLETYFVLLLSAALIITALLPLLAHIPTHLLPF